MKSVKIIMIVLGVLFSVEAMAGKVKWFSFNRPAGSAMSPTIRVTADQNGYKGVKPTTLNLRGRMQGKCKYVKAYRKLQLEYAWVDTGVPIYFFHLIGTTRRSLGRMITQDYSEYLTVNANSHPFLKNRLISFCDYKKNALLSRGRSLRYVLSREHRFKVGGSVTAALKCGIRKFGRFDSVKSYSFNINVICEKSAVLPGSGGIPTVGGIMPGGKPDLQPAQGMKIGGVGIYSNRTGNVNASSATQFKNGKCLFPVEYVVKNTSHVTAGRFQDVVTIGSARGPVYQHRRLLGNRERRVRAAIWAAPGLNTIKLKVDETNRLAEANERNNERVVLLNVQGNCSKGRGFAPKRRN